MGLMMEEEDGPLFKNKRDKKMTPGSDLESWSLQWNLRLSLLLSVKKRKESGMRNSRELRIVL
jgi:hypothetical protein